MMVNSKEAMEALKKQLDQWESEGILEEKLKEHGFIVLDRSVIVKENDASAKSE